MSKAYLLGVWSVLYFIPQVCSLLYVVPVDGKQSDITKTSSDLLPSSNSPCNTTSEPCRMNQNSLSARVTHPKTVFPTYSCVTRNARRREVHVISTYEGFGHKRKFNELPTVVGRIKLHVTRLPSSGDLPVVLVLTSYEAIQWEITTQKGVQIEEINLLSSFARQSDVQVDQIPAPNIKQERRYFGFGRRSHRNSKLLAYTRGRYGLVTSFTGVFSVNSTDTWNLDTGISGSCDDNYDFISDTCNKKFDGYYPHPKNCSKFINCQAGTVHPLVCDLNTRWSQQHLACLAAEDVECKITAVPPGGPIGQVEHCLKSQRCWVEYNFHYDTRWSNCSGKQYMSHTQYPGAPFLGVVLCDKKRYKLFLSAAPWEEFLNIADSSGHGADHCELVGGSEGGAVLPIDYWDSPITTGYYRAHWEENFHKGPIGHGPRNESEWTGRLYTSWYECGVTIPGDYQVLPVADFPRPTTPLVVLTETPPPETTTERVISVETTTTSTTTTTMAGVTDPILEFNRIPHNVTEVVGKKHILLQCGTNLGADIIWRKEGEVLPSVPSTRFPGIIVRRGGVLRITELRFSHQGRYTCEAALPDIHHKFIRTHAWITVIQPPTTPTPTCGIAFTSHPQDMIKEDGDISGITLSCVTDPSEGVNIQWLKNGRPINNIDDDVIWLINDDLFISELTLSHAGEYTCVATREADGCSYSSSGILRVQHLGNLSHVCGRPAVQPLSVSNRGLISGGSDARKRAEPWIAQLCHEDPRAGCFCGGVLISSSYVLTAAHCLDASQHTKFLQQGFSVNRRTLIIKLGKLNQFETEEGQLIVRPDEDFIMHADYSGQTYDNDIALIHINTMVTPSDQILPICLESGGFLERHFHSIRGSRGVVSGWGVLSSGSKPQNLQEVELPLHDHATCQDATDYTVTENMFCAGYASTVVEGSACKGDSGGPYIMKYDNVWYLVGLVSWGNPSQRCDRTYGYYTKMAKYYAWVIDQTGLLE